MTRPTMANRAVLWLLQSPLAGLIDGSVCRLDVPGWATGRRYRLPVQWATGEDSLWIWCADAGRKTWWRNLREPTEVGLRLRGEDLVGTAVVIDNSCDPALHAAGRSAYQRRCPRSRLAADDVLVRVRVDADPLDRARAAVAVPGRGVRSTARRHPLAVYYLLAFAISWSWWVPVALAGGHVTHFPGLLGPLVAALLTSALLSVDDQRRLLGDMARICVPIRWYAFCLLPLAAAGVTLAVFSLWGDAPSWADLGTMDGVAPGAWWVVAMVVLVVNGFGEETGWRGFVWPRLRRRHTLGGAALLLAVPWALWHAPLLWIDSGFRGFSPLLVPGFVAGLTAGAVVLGWLYERSGNSIPVVALWHTSMNMASATRGAADVAPAVSAVVISLAIGILRRQPSSDPGG